MASHFENYDPDCVLEIGTTIQRYQEVPGSVENPRIQWDAIREYLQEIIGFSFNYCVVQKFPAISCLKSAHLHTVEVNFSPFLNR